MTDLNRCLAANLKSLRNHWQLSQADLAEKGDVSVGYVGDLEVGAKWPSAEVLVRLAAALQVKPYQLFLDPDDTLVYQAWLERRDLVVEMGERLFDYFEKRRG